jgi:hypothetical protein
MTIRRRILRIRRTVAAVAVSVFIALFAAIYIQMASGNDPALAAPAQSAAPSTTQSAPDSSTAPTPTTTRQS